MLKGWILVSLYCPNDHPGTVYIDFAHYTGRNGWHGGSDYDKTLSGYITIESFRRALRKHLQLGPGYHAREEHL